jgi:hypothetical protein
VPSWRSMLGRDLAIPLAKMFGRSWGNPSEAPRADDQLVRERRYRLLWDLYQGTAFDNEDRWRDYKGTYSLYRQVRQLWDHAHALVEFYTTHIWTGSLAKDGLNLPNGVRNAVPLVIEPGDEDLAAAIGQLWSWWVFQEQKDLLVRYTAALGETLVELVDDVEKGRVYIDVVWPGKVADIQLDISGNITSYEIKYEAEDSKGDTFTYRRVVDKESFRFYRDDELVRTVENPYGFVPARWFRHHRVLGVRGEPAIWSTQGQLDEVNSLFSNIIDKAHVSLRAPVLISGNVSSGAFQRALSSIVGTAKRVATGDLDVPTSGREELNILQGPQGTQISTIELEISEAGEALDRLIASIERKCPEITYYEKLRDMTQITGPSADNLMGDVAHRVRQVAGSYDAHLIALCQMGVAIAGWRRGRREGGWVEDTPDRAKFDGFDLESWEQGDLDFDIMPRPLVHPSEEDTLRVIGLRRQVIPIYPIEQAAMDAGYDEDTVAEWMAQAKREGTWPPIEQQMAKVEMEMAEKPGAPPGNPGRPPGIKDRRTTASSNGSRR